MNPATRTHTDARFCVLVVDDEADHCFMTQERLRSQNVDVRLASSGDEALKMLDGVDLVLLDYVLPGRSGLETLREIRAMNGPSVVLVTAMGSEGVVVEAMRAGAVDYLVKDDHYLQSLPQVIERAWRSHDLARQSHEVQRLALLVSSAVDRDSVVCEIVQGAQSLLRAQACLLFLVQQGGLHLKASAGTASADSSSIRESALSALKMSDPISTVVDGSRAVLVPVHGADGDALGVLAVLAADGHDLEHGETELAITFASFCGLALGHLKQLELERSVANELQEMLDLRRELVAAVSHELRTPLTCILGFTSTLTNHWFDLEDDVRRDFLDKVRKHGLELAELVDGLLDFASTEAGRLAASIVEVEVAQVAAEVLSQLAPVLNDRPVDVTGDAPVAMADPILLARTLSNLLSNAVKYSALGTRITVDVRGEGAWVRVSVVDEGVGMSPEESERAFEPFWRAGRGIARKRGTGIGLGLVRDYVRLMGGSVTVVSTPGTGSTFSFTLPARMQG